MEEHVIDLSSARLLVVGCGNLGSALVRAFCANNIIDPHRIYVKDRNPGKAEALAEELKVQTVTNLSDAADEVEIILLAVKPKAILDVAAEISQGLIKVSSRPLVISVAAGVKTVALQQRLGAGVSVCRAMPNMAALVGASVTGLFAPDPAELEVLEKLFSSIGLVVPVQTEDGIDAITGLAASGLAFASVAVEAMADGGVKGGLARAEALKIAAQTVLGACKLILDGGWHPAQLKDAIASPGGTTIAGLHVIETGGVRGALLSAVVTSTERAKELSKG